MYYDAAQLQMVDTRNSCIQKLQCTSTLSMIAVCSCFSELFSVISSACVIWNIKRWTTLSRVSLRMLPYHSVFALTQKFLLQWLTSCPSTLMYFIVLYCTSHNQSRLPKSLVTNVTISDAAYIMKCWPTHAQ